MADDRYCLARGSPETDRLGPEPELRVEDSAIYAHPGVYGRFSAPLGRPGGRGHCYLFALARRGICSLQATRHAGIRGTREVPGMELLVSDLWMHRKTLDLVKGRGFICLIVEICDLVYRSPGRVRGKYHSILSRSETKIHLRSAVSSVNNEISSCGIGGRIRRQVKIGALELLRLTLPTHGDLIAPEVLGLLRHKVGDLRRDVTGGNGVGPGKLDPLDGERLACMAVSTSDGDLTERVKRNAPATKEEEKGTHTEVDDGGFGGVVGGLHLREIDNVSTHRSGGHKAPVGEVAKFVAVQVGSLLLLSPPVRRGGPGAVKGTVEVNVNDARIVVEGAVDHRAFGPWDTGVGYKHVQAAVEVLHDLVDSLLHGLGICDVDLISLGCWLLEPV